MIREHDLTQGSDEWIAARCGLLTASEMKLMITPNTLMRADNDKTRAHLYELLAQRLSGYVEPSYVSDDMLAGYEGEMIARELYAKHVAPVRQVGFITNDRWGFTLGYSPDGLVGGDGLIEIKTHRQKAQVKAILEDYADGDIPAEHALQVQTGLLVSGRAWCDFIAYSPGLPMTITRTLANPVMQEAIVAAADAFEARLAQALKDYRHALAQGRRHIDTERVVLGEIAA
jgi:hypothetical protein